MREDLSLEEDRKCFAPEAKNPPACLRCGRPLDRHLATNALSRYANVMICNACGSDEAMRDYAGVLLPLREWQAVKDGDLPAVQAEGNASIMPECPLPEIFHGPQKEVPLSGFPVPESKLVHSRTDYDGQKWWTTWHPCNSEKPPEELVQEIDEFQNCLMANIVRP